MKKLSLSVTRTMAFMTFGFILAGVINLVNESNVDNAVLIASTGIIAGLSLLMLVLNTVIAAKIIDSQHLLERVPTKLIGSGLSLTALLLTAGIATLILAIKIQPSATVYTILYILMGILSLPQSIISGNIGLRLN